MGIQTGKQPATILKNWVCVDPKAQMYINLKLSVDGGELYTRIYITPKSAGIARAALKKCGFALNADCNNLDDIDMNEDFLGGKKVQVEVVENGKYMNANIIVERERAPKEAMEAAKAMLRGAKKGDDAADSDIPF